jgi:glycerophosphoryl diester phosphodiesterase
MDNPFLKDSSMPMLVAHGGGNGEFPDNTLEAFYNAYSVDTRAMMETDVNLTKDGILILSHDTTLDRKTNVTGPICEWNYSDLMAEKVDFGYDNPTIDETLNGKRQRYKDGNGMEKSPLDVAYPDGVLPRDETVFLATTLEDLLVAFPQNLISVEIKQPGELGQKALQETLRLLEKYDAFDQVVIGSFYPEIHDTLLKLQKDGLLPEELLFSANEYHVTKFFILQLLKLDVFFDDNICILQIPTEEYGIPLDLRGLVKAAHKHNMAVQYWTINDAEEMRHIIELGADGITTDYPHLFKEVYENSR